MTFPTLPKENRIIKTCDRWSHCSDDKISFRNSSLEDVLVRVLTQSGKAITQYYDKANSIWKNFSEEVGEWKIGLEKIIEENQKRDHQFAEELREALKVEEVDISSLTSLFKQAFEGGYIEASEVIFDQFVAQSEGKFDSAALRKIYSTVSPPIESDGGDRSRETYKNTCDQPVVDLSQRQNLRDRVTAYVKTRNTQHRKDIVTSSVPIDAIRMSLETSLGPRRYQAILGILHNDCGASLGELQEYVGNSEKFKKIKFDHEDCRKDDPENELTKFNQEALNLLNQNDDKLWKKLDKFLREEAYKKDLSRIVEKLKPDDELKETIESNLQAIYSGGAIEEPFNQLKIILISERLKGKGVKHDKALELATRFVVKKESLEDLWQDEAVLQMDEKNKAPEKFEAIFTKYAAFGKISDATQLRKRVLGKILSQFQKKFAEQIHDLDGIQTVEMEGNEVLFRGIDAGSQLTEDLIKQQFEDIHIGISTADGISQHISSYKIQENRIPGPGGLLNRAGYAAATTFNFAVAAKYAGDAGWIYDIRPKKGKVATNLQVMSPDYQEIDFEVIDPEEIYAVYKVSQKSKDEGEKINKIERVILNPHYKKREGDPLDLLLLEQEIQTQNHDKSACGGGPRYFVTRSDNSSFVEFDEKQMKIHKDNYSMGSHLREASATLMQNKGSPKSQSSLWASDHRYSRSFSGAEMSEAGAINNDVAAADLISTATAPKAAEKTALQENEELWSNYKENAAYLQGWFWGNLEKSVNGNNFKVFISVEPDDLNKATEILIKNGYFNYQQLPECAQKIPPYSEEDTKTRLAIILYAQGEKTGESDAAWTARLNAIEKDFYEAGIKPRPLVSKEEAAVGSISEDRKFPGSLYSYYKKDVEAWDWQKDNYFSGIEINVAESIKQKVGVIELKIQEAVATENLSEQNRLNKTLQAEKLYLQISQVGPERTEYVQSGADINVSEKTAEAEVVTLVSRWFEPVTLKKEVREMTLERARYFWANDLRRSTNIRTYNADILTATTDAIVNAGNEVLDMGNYGVSGLSKAVHDEFGYGEEVLRLDVESRCYFKSKESNLVKALLKGGAATEDCEIYVGACDARGNKILEREQAKDDDGNLLFLDAKGRKLTTKKTEFAYHKQAQIKVRATKLRTGEVAIAEIGSDLNSKQMESGGVKFVIHALGPDCRGDEFRVLEGDAEEVASSKIAARKQALENTYKALLEKALENGVKKIAVPVLSIGVFQYPEEEAAQVIGGVLRDFRSKFEEISIFTIDPKNKEQRPAVLDLIEQNLFQKNFDLMQKSNKSETPWKRSSQDQGGAEIVIEKPSRNVKASLFSPLMTLNEKHIWYVAEDPDGSLDPNNRANKFKVVDGIYGKEKSDTSEIKDTFIDILLKVAAGSDDSPKRQSLTQQQVLAIIAKAKERGGIKNEANAQGEYLKPASEIEDIFDIPAVEAKKFSAAFQKECEACGIYSGRKGGKSVGLRLTFISDDVVEKFAKLSEVEYGERAAKAEANLQEVKIAIGNQH